jgi:hypothetical protein
MHGKRPHRGTGPSGAVREAEEVQAGGGARIIKTAAGSGKTLSTARAIAALTAEAGLARGHRTAGRAAVWET